MTREEAKRRLREMGTPQEAEEKMTSGDIEIEAPKEEPITDLSKLSREETKYLLNAASSVGETPYSQGRTRAENEGKFINDVKDRKVLTDYYNAYIEDFNRALENNDQVTAYTDKILADRIAQKLGRTSTPYTAFQDFGSEITTNVKGFVADVAEKAVQTKIGLVDSLDPNVLYSVAKHDSGTLDNTLDNYVWGKNDWEKLEKLHTQYPNDEIITNLYETVKKQGYKGDKQYFEDVAAYVNDLANKQNFKTWQQEHTLDEQQARQNLDTREELSYNDFGKFLLDAAGVVSYMLPSIGLGAGVGATTGTLGTASTLQGAASIGSMSLAAAGNATTNALNQGYGWTQSNVYGNLSGMLEGLSELIGGEFVNSLLFGGTVSTPMGKALQTFITKNNITSPAVKFALSALSEVNAEGLEEMFTEFFDPILRDVILKEDVDYSTVGSDMLKAYVSSILPTLVLGGMGSVRVNKSIDAYTTYAENEIMSSTQFTQEQKAKMINDLRQAANDAKLGIIANYEDIQNKLKEELDKAAPGDERIRQIRELIGSSEGLTNQEMNNVFNRYINEKGLQYNPYFGTTQELLDSNKPADIKYNDQTQVEIDEGVIMGSSKNITGIDEVTTTNKAKANVQALLTSLAKLLGKNQVVLADITTNDGSIVMGATNNQIGNVFVNANLDVKDMLAAGFHELGHTIEEKYPNVFNYFKSALEKATGSKLNEVLTAYNNVVGLYDTNTFTEEQKNYLIGELLGDHVGEWMSKLENTKSIEKSTKSLFDNLKGILDKVSNVVTGKEIQNKDVSQYNLNLSSYLDTNLLEDETLNKMLLDIFEGKKVDQIKKLTEKTKEIVKETKEVTKKTEPKEETSKKETPKKPEPKKDNSVNSRIEKRYAEMKDTAKTPAILKMIAEEAGLKYDPFNKNGGDNARLQDILTDLRDDGKITETGTRYSVGGKRGAYTYAEKYDVVDFLKKRIQTAVDMRNEDNAKIMANTGFYFDDNGDLKFSFSDKDMTLKPNIAFKPNTQYKLGDILQHDLLFKIYPELADYNVAFKEQNRSTKWGSFNRKTNEIALSNKLLNLKEWQKMTEKTLIHEIQHAIQNIEGYARGESSWSKKAYYSSLGENEARDTADRFVQEKYGNADLRDVLPISAIKGYVSPEFEKYMQNRKVKDLLKDLVYPTIKEYLEKEGRSYEETVKKLVAQENETNLGRNAVGGNITNGTTNGETKTRVQTTNRAVTNLSTETNSKQGSFSMSKDSNGRTLTKAQIEYFKDSKVRDERGNLLVMFHGSSKYFTVFDKNMIRAYDYDAPFNGFWFSDDRDTMPGFAPSNYKKEVYLNITNPAPNKVWHEVVKEVEKEALEHDKGTDGGASFPETFNKNSRSEDDEVRYRLQAMGYDGIHWDGTPNVNWQELKEKGRTTFKSVRGLGTYILAKNEEDGGIDLLDKYGELITGFEDKEDFLSIQEEVWVAFEPNQIKLVDNTNPTDNPDTRFSKRKGEYDRDEVINNQRTEIAKTNKQVEKWKGKANKAQEESKTNKNIAKGRGRALKWSWKKNTQERKTTEKWKGKTRRITDIALDLKYETQLDRKAQADGISFGREYKDLFIGLRRAGDSIEKAYEMTKGIYEESQRLNKSIDNSMQILNDLRKGKVYNKLPAELKAKIDEYDKFWTKSRQMSDLTLAKRILTSATIKELIGKVAISKSVQNKITDFDGKYSKSLVDAFNGSIALAEQFEQGLEQLRDDVKAFQAENFTAKAAEEMAEERKAIKDSVITELDKQSNSKIRNFIKNYTNKTIGRNLMTFKTETQALMGGNIDTPLMILEKNLQNGEMRKKQAIVNAYTMLNEFLTKSSGINRAMGVEKWKASLEKSLARSSDWVDTGIKVKGKELRLPRSMMMSLAMHLLNDQNMSHISGAITNVTTDDNGDTKVTFKNGEGIRVPNESLYKRGNINDAYDTGRTVKLTYDQVQEIVSQLTEEEKQFVEATKKVFEYTSKLINEVSNKLYGYDIATVENYFPIHTWRKGTPIDALHNVKLNADGKINAYDYLASAGWLQDRVTSFAPIYLENIAEVLDRSINNVANYYGYAEALRNNNILLNESFDEPVAYGDDKETQTLREALGDLSSSYIKDYDKLTRFIVGAETLKDGKFRGLMAMNTLTFNIGTWLTQPMSFFNTLKYFSTKDFLRGINPINNHIKLDNMIRQYYEDLGIDTSNINDYQLARSFISMATPNLDYRALGYKLPEVKQLYNKRLADKIGAHGIEAFDNVAVTAVARMEAWVLSQEEGLEFGSEEYFERLGSELTQILVETQPEFSHINRANMFRSTNPIARMLSLFGTPANQMMNNFMQSSMEVFYEAREGKVSKEAMSTLAKSMSGIIVSSVLVGLIRALRDQIRNDDDEIEFTDRWVAQSVIAMLGPTLILDDLAQMIMSHKEFGGISSYDFNTPETTFVNGLSNLVEKTIQLTDGEVSPARKTKDIIRALGVVTPIDTKSLVRTFEALMKVLAPDVYKAYALQTNATVYKQWLKHSDTDMATFYKAYEATRTDNLTKNYGYHKADKENNVKSNLKEAREAALKDVLDSQAQVDEYMEVLFGYKK